MSTAPSTPTIPKVALRALTELTGEPRFDVALLIALRAWTPTGPSTYSMWISLPEASITVCTSSATLTYSSVPMLVGPSRSDCISV